MLFLAIILLGFFITKPLLPSLVTAAIIAYLSYPLYKRTLKRITNKNIAALIVTILILLLFTIPFIVVLGFISKEAYSTYTTLSKQNLGTNFLKVVCGNRESFSCRAVNFIVGFLPEENLDYYLQLTIEAITRFILDNASKFFVSIPNMFLKIFVMAFVIYYMLRDGDVITRRIKNILPLKESHKKHILKRFHSITSAVFYGNIAVALIQGSLGVIGFFVLGVSSPILWGFVMTVFALIPYFGTGIVWLPAALNLIFIGYLQNDNSFLIRGVVLILYGLFVIGLIDNFLKPKLIGEQGKVHPILVLVGVLGGLHLFGFIGFVLGPVMLALLMTFVDIYEEEKAELKKYF